MQCPACECDVRPFHEMAANGRTMIRKCPRIECGAAMPSADEVRSSGDASKVVRLDSKAPLIVREGPVTGSPRPVASLGECTDADSLVRLAKERLAYVDARIAELAELKAERKALVRMIGRKS
jgi:hypothetical protein